MIKIETTAQFSGTYSRGKLSLSTHSVSGPNTLSNDKKQPLRTDG